MMTDEQITIRGLQGQVQMLLAQLELQAREIERLRKEVEAKTKATA